MKGTYLFLVEYSPLFRFALSSMLKSLGFSIKSCDTAHLSFMKSKKPDVILFDIVTFPEDSGQLEHLVNQCSRVAPVLLLARDDHIEQILIGLKAGAFGFVKQTAAVKELDNAITSIAGGKTWCDTEFFSKIMKYLPTVPSSRLPRLTKREKEVLQFLPAGQSNKEIAAHLGLAEHTVKVHVSNLFRKTRAANRSNLAVYAITSGLVSS